MDVGHHGAAGLGHTHGGLVDDVGGHGLGGPIPAKVLATRLIPNVSPDMAKELGLTPDQKSLAR